MSWCLLERPVAASRAPVAAAVGDRAPPVAAASIRAAAPIATEPHDGARSAPRTRPPRSRGICAIIFTRSARDRARHQPLPAQAHRHLRRHPARRLGRHLRDARPAAGQRRRGDARRRPRPPKPCRRSTASSASTGPPLERYGQWMSGLRDRRPRHQRLLRHADRAADRRTAAVTLPLALMAMVLTVGARARRSASTPRRTTTGPATSA